MAMAEGTTTRSLEEVAGEIITLDRETDDLASRGMSRSDPEWRWCDDRLMEIGKELYAEGGEARMQAALELAYRSGLRGRYAERHWSGIGSWMG